jgi:hypothetical protein
VSGEDCPCGSGLPCEELFDARGIHVGLVCDKCAGKRKARYRAEVFADPNYTCDEPIEPDD